MSDEAWEVIHRACGCGRTSGCRAVEGVGERRKVACEASAIDNEHLAPSGLELEMEFGVACTRTDEVGDRSKVLRLA